MGRWEHSNHAPTEGSHYFALEHLFQCNMQWICHGHWSLVLVAYSIKENAQLAMVDIYWLVYHRVLCADKVSVYLPRLPITVCIAEEISFLSRPHNVEAGGGQLSGPLTLRHVIDV